jgi:AcrR family transcriptional regulator
MGWMEAELAKPRRSGRPDGKASETLDRHILATASRLFIENGYAGTSIEQVAAEVGAGKQTIYRRYGSKEALFKAAITNLDEMLLGSAAIAEASPTDPLTLGSGAKFAFSHNLKRKRLMKSTIIAAPKSQRAGFGSEQEISDS